MAATLVTSASFVFRPGALQPGESYAFDLVARDAGGTASARLSITTSALPRGTAGRGSVGTLRASAASGVAFTTAFSLFSSGWLDEDGPLQFQYEYTVDGSGRPPVVLSRFSPAPVLSDITLPAGLDSAGNLVTLRLCVHFESFISNRFLPPSRPRAGIIVVRWRTAAMYSGGSFVPFAR